jgi:hypothetical protein
MSFRYSVAVEQIYAAKTPFPSSVPARCTSSAFLLFAKDTGLTASAQASRSVGHGRCRNIFINDLTKARFGIDSSALVVGGREEAALEFGISRRSAKRGSLKIESEALHRQNVKR